MKITSPLLTDEVLSIPRIDVVSFLKKMRIKAGVGLIDLSVGNPDLPPCQEAIDELLLRSASKNIHGYGNFDGQPVLHDSIKNYYKKKYNKVVDSDQINIIRGVRNLLFTVAYIFAGPKDTILIPSIGYQSYYLATIFNRSTPYFVQMNENSGYIPDIDSVPISVLKKTKLLYLNYPNNPTGSQISREQLAHIVDVCKKYGILICYDNAYNEILFDGLEPISLFEFPGSEEIGIEITSMSKLTGLAGWRIAFCVANKEISELIWKYNSVTDSAVYDGFQYAGAIALNYVVENDDGKRISKVYENRRNIIAKGFDAAGISYFKPQGGFYMWLNVPEDKTDEEFVEEICSSCKVLLTPGSYYGDDGKKFVRLSLTASDANLIEAAKRIANFKSESN